MVEEGEEKGEEYGEEEVVEEGEKVVEEAEEEEGEEVEEEAGEVLKKQVRFRQERRQNTTKRRRWSLMVGRRREGEEGISSTHQNRLITRRIRGDRATDAITASATPAEFGVARAGATARHTARHRTAHGTSNGTARLIVSNLPAGG
ncbi:hypothetical protein CBR_g34934 [Chara braunii]|uniref:Uncharacterized protein n=1 Tax=Chara braunii TaxID=69332 RepID=A0A388LJR4_CHABU|nr:hypothetical protein CBR_g34934 [Chara braunii]|eukprot:GBG82558.1 hypothetical protein CBR_g34934 [Chara braunii]